MRSRIGAALIAMVCWTVVLVAPAQATFPGKNGKIAFTRSGPGNPGEIYTMNADGTGITNITNNPAADQDPAWSPDGTKIAFASSRSGDYEIYTMNVDGTNVFKVTQDQTATGPSWSPDGTKILFTVSGTFGRTLHVINADGSGDTVLQTPTFAVHGRWSPDGSTIAFATFLLRFPSQIATIKPDGTAFAQLTNDGAESFDPDWSPDGTQLVFASTRDQFAGEIYTMNPDGTGVNRLTNNVAQEEGPAFSPDGQRIVFVSGRDDPNLINCFFCLHHIYVMNADGSGQTRLTDTSEHDQTPSWQPIVGPQRSDYKNAAKFCKAEREFLGNAAFTNKYGGGANAYGKCVSGK